MSLFQAFAKVNDSFWNSLFTDNKKFPTNFEEAHRGGYFQKSDATVNQINAEEINAIKQQQIRPFRVIDIDPNSLDKEGFWSVYGDDVLSRMFGPTQNGFGIAGVRIDNEGAGTILGRPSPYYRTIQLDIPGDYLKVEFLPARSQGQGRYVETSVLENPVNTIPQNTNLTENSGQFFGMAEAAGGRQILVDFETVSATPILAEDGDEFKNYFSTVFLTFQQLNVRIRVTIGYGAEVRSKNYKETNLYMFGGRGLTTKSPIHPIAFCLTDREADPTTVQGVLMTAGFTQNLLFNIDRPAPATPGTGYGNAIFYITGFNGMLIQSTAIGGSYGVYDIELLQCGIDLVYNPTNVIKRITKMTLISNSQAANADSSNGNFVTKCFTQPIRVNLRPMECLALRWTQLTSGSNSSRLKFEIEGYSFGTMVSSALDGSTSCPMFFNTMFSENPFPQDMDTQDLPRR